MNEPITHPELYEAWRKVEQDSAVTRPEMPAVKRGRYSIVTPREEWRPARRS